MLIAALLVAAVDIGLIIDKEVSVGHWEQLPSPSPTPTLEPEPYYERLPDDQDDYYYDDDTDSDA